MKNKILVFLALLAVCAAVAGLLTVSFSAATMGKTAATVRDGETQATGGALSLFAESHTPSPLDEYGRDAQGIEFTLDGEALQATVSTAKHFHGAGEGEAIVPSAVIKDGVTYTVSAIDTKAFFGNALVRLVAIPASVIRIGDGAFGNCVSLEKIIVEDKNTHYSSDDGGVLYDQSKAQLICYPAGSRASAFTVPSTVSSIKAGAFGGVQNLSTLHLSFVGGSRSDIAAADTSLFGYLFGTTAYPNATRVAQYHSPSEYTSYYIPTCIKNVTVGGASANTVFYGAFYGCFDLESIVVNEGVVTVEEKAFYGCSSLKRAVIPAGVSSIGSAAFGKCGALEELTLPFVGGSANATGASASTLFGYIFGTDGYAGGVCINQSYGRATKSYYIPSSLKRVSVAGGNILYGAFYNCDSLNSVILPDGLSAIGAYAFYGCSSLRQISVGDTVSTIGKDAFRGCSALETVYIGQNATDLSAFDFKSYPALQKIIVSPDNTAYASDGYGVLFNKDKTVLLCYPQAGSAKIYCVPSTVAVIASGAFVGNQELTEVVVPLTVSSIADGNFLGFAGVSLSVPLNSAAHSYALDNGIPFRLNDPESTCYGISVKTLPHRTVFVEGTEICFSGLVVVAEGDTGLVEVEDYVLRYEASTVGTHTVTVSYQGFTADFDIRIVRKSVVGIEITQKPTKTEYQTGAPLDLSGIVVTAYYDNGTSEAVIGYTCSGYDPDLLGEQTVTIAYGGHTAAFAVVCREAPMGVLSLKSANAGAAWGLEFLTSITGEQISGTGGSFVLHLDDSVAAFVSCEAAEGVTVTRNGALIFVTVSRAVPDGGELLSLTLKASEFLASGETVFLTLAENSIHTAAFAPLVIYEMGDANMDGEVNARDAVLIQQHIVKMITLRDEQLAYANVYADETLSARDAVLIKQAIVKMPVALDERVAITFLNKDGSVYAVRSVKRGCALSVLPTPPSASAPQGYEAYWDLTETDLSKITEAVTVPYAERRLAYTVSFLDERGELLKTETILHGQAAAAPTAPLREDTIFERWDTAFACVKSDLTVTAVYRQKEIYTVTFKDYTGLVLGTASVKETDTAIAPITPTRDGYTFTGWSDSLDRIEENKTVIARYSLVGGDNILDLAYTVNANGTVTLTVSVVGTVRFAGLCGSMMLPATVPNPILAPKGETVANLCDGKVYFVCTSASDITEERELFSLAFTPSLDTVCFLFTVDDMFDEAYRTVSHKVIGEMVRVR